MSEEQNNVPPAISVDSVSQTLSNAAAGSSLYNNSLNLAPVTFKRLMEEFQRVQLNTMQVPEPHAPGVAVRIGKRGVFIWTVSSYASTTDGSHYKYTLTRVTADQEGGSRQTRRNVPHARLFALSGDEATALLRKENEAIRAKQREQRMGLFNSVVISQYKRKQILDAINQIHQHDLIFKRWGFENTIEKGRGVAMLFYGPPGTGKTLMAEAIANMLSQKLQIVSNADIQSSAPGEAERNIRAAFDDAKNNSTILLFDECDSLIFTRRAAGPILAAQINELLSQIERFDGITLFTTNRLGQLDEAVNRRLALKLEFDMPTPKQRAKIWERMIPKQAPLHKDVSFERLAEIEVTGGYIKNAVLRAARIASSQEMDDSKKQITMQHFIDALIQEVESLEDFEDAVNNADGVIPINGAMHRSKTKIELARQQ